MSSLSFNSNSPPLKANSKGVSEGLNGNKKGQVLKRVWEALCKAKLNKFLFWRKPQCVK